MTKADTTAVRGERADPRSPSQGDVRSVVRLLAEVYGSPRLGNPTDPLDDLFYILLSNRTSPVVTRRTYREFRSRYSPWEKLLSADPGELQSLLEPAGLSRKRTSQFLAIVDRLEADFGEVTLGPLASWENVEAESYLCELPGVSTKVAKCVMMYGFGRDVLPVDAHVHRITGRLGWQSKSRADQTHRLLEELVPEELRFDLHVNCVAHGRSVCRPTDPECSQCPLTEYCDYYLDDRAEGEHDAH